MKKAKTLFLFIFLVFSLILSSCSFLFDTTNSNSKTSDNSGTTQVIEDFDFVADNKMVFVNSSANQYYNLVLYAGENYQIKTTIDDKLGNDYYFEFSVDSDYEVNGQFTLSDTGYIETNSSITESGIFVIDVDLYKKGQYKKIESKYFIFSLRVGEYANITLTNENLIYDSSSNTYSMTLESGNTFNLAYQVSSNTTYALTFNLTDPNQSTFINVDENGKITTSKTNESKIGEITIKLIGANGVLSTVYVKITVIKSDSFENVLVVTNQNNAEEIHNADILNLYKDNEISFDVKYNNELKTNVILVEDSSVLEVNNSNNTIKGLKVGTSEVTFSYEDKQITITVNVILDTLLSIESENKGNDFIIINDSLLYLNNMYAIYQSGTRKEISNTNLITTSISNKNETYKTVKFTYLEDDTKVEVSYDVRYYVAEEFVGRDTAYDNNDLYNHSVHGVAQPLPNKGTVKLLVVPIWFNDSTDFFKVEQQEQIIEDIEYTVNGNRPNNEFYSVKQYYESQSYGAIEMDITVSEFYNSSTSYKDYTDISSSYKSKNTSILATDAISWYFNSHSNESFEDYDLNDDGFIDGIILYYGANYYGEESDENRSTAYERTNYGNNEYSFNTLAFCPIGSLYGRNKLNISAQLSSSDLSATFERAFTTSGRTIIHEMGHMFGNDDLYEFKVGEEKYAPAGGFIMQDDNSGGHDPYHVNRLGWSKPQVYASSDYNLGDKITLNLSDFQTSGQNIILTNNWNSANSLFDEYIILELFAPTGLNEFDAKVSFNNTIDSGIRVWHVNSTLKNYTTLEEGTSEIIDGNKYDFLASNYDASSEYDMLHLIRNNPNEPYNTQSGIAVSDTTLFKTGDSFDMETFKSQFKNGNKLDNKDKLGWEFKVESIVCKADGSYDSIITLERTDNAKTEFSQTITLNRSDLSTPDGKEDYSNEIFGTDGNFSFNYQYVTPPSAYNQNYPISSNGMCLFASANGNGGYIDITIKDIDGKEVCIESISVTYSKLTNASLTVIANNNVLEGSSFTPANDSMYGQMYQVNSTSVRVQNQYNETINHWSVIALYEITINYTIK